MSSPGARPWPLLWVIGAGLGGLGVIFLVGSRFGAPPVVLLLAGTAIASVIALFWNSLRTLLGETRLTGADAYAIGAPRAEEEQKRAVLRALKDLEFERSVGKISEDDYRELVARYRHEAKRLLRLIDDTATEERAHAEKLVQSRLARAGIARAAEPAPPAPAEQAADPAPEPSAAAEEPSAAAEKASAAAEEPSAAAEEPSAAAEEEKASHA